MKNIWIIGCGDIGRRVAKRINALYQDQVYRINALVSSQASATQCHALDINTLIHDLDSDAALPVNDFQDALVYYFAPPPGHGEQDTRLQTVLHQLGNLPRRIVLISTTGVYGNCEGGWVDETSPVRPQTDRAKRRASAEQTVQHWAAQYQREYLILRVPGIYALDRLPLERLRKNLPVVQHSEAAYTNRIHADDLAAICIKAMESPLTAEVFNTTDGHPGTMVDYFNQVADYAGLPRPPQISLQEANEKLSKGMLSYALESRRIRNDKLLSRLNIELMYPDISSALK